MYSVNVGYTPAASVDVFPPITAGTLEDVWVRTNARSTKEAIEAAKRKIRECYGIGGSGWHVYRSSWHRS